MAVTEQKSAPADPGSLTRRHFLRRAALAGLAAGGGAYGIDRLLSSGTPVLQARPTNTAAAVLRFRSRPDLLPCGMSVSPVPASSGYMFLGPEARGGSQPGLLIAGNRGEPVWFRPVDSDRWVTDLRVSSYRGEPVLTWWQGKVLSPGYGQGEGVILDARYRRRAIVRAGNRRTADLHEMLLTPQGTALITCYPLTVRADLSKLGGPKNATVLESVFQEVDVVTGRVLLEWRSLDHIALEESYYRPLSAPYDYLHINSLEVLPDGNLLLSARHTSALYKLDRRTGAVIWRLGGRRSDFAMGAGSQFHWQHDARMVGDGLVSVFDDGSNGTTNTEKHSRGLLLAVDETGRTVKLLRAYTHPSGVLTAAMGSMQVLPDGEVVIGWGTAPYLTQFGTDGQLVADAVLPKGQNNYRGFRFNWQAQPASDPPALTARVNARTGARTLYASWNGATEVAAWLVRLGSHKNSLHPAAVAGRAGFETAIPIGTAGRMAAVTAVDRHGRHLRSSPAIRL